TSNPIVDNVQAATALQAFQAAQPYAPNLSGATPPKAPLPVITGLEQNAGRPGQALADVLRGIRAGRTPLEAIAAMPTGLKTQMVGLIFFTPLAVDLQHGKTITAAQIASVAKSSSELASDLVAAQKIVPAQAVAPGEWRRWWWICLGGQVLLLVLVFFMRGRWSPAAARRELRERERLIDEELAELTSNTRSDRELISV
ncbi:MAG TPA: hypothetical protein VKR22_09200, partial [Acidimicrobiales bacterium]|nr:hypothetical protein [Acidimicrobiales bacterium]